MASAPVEPTTAAELPPVPGSVRIIAGQGISPLPPQATPPQRVAMPVKPKPPDPIEPRLLARAMIEDGGTVRAGAIRIRMPELQPLAPEETCRDAAGVEWPCGRQALTAIRAFVRTHGVSCPLPKSARSGSFEAACRLGSLDFAEWAIGQGWARTGAATGPLAEAAARAKRDGLGIHRAEAPAMRASPEIAPDLPPDPSLAPLGAAGR